MSETAQVGDTAIRSPSPLKSEWRRWLRRQRAALPLALRRRAATIAAMHLTRALLGRGARRVSVYLACGSELPTAALIAALRRHRIRVFVPRLRGCNQMHWTELGPRARLKPNRHGIGEPTVGRRRIATSSLDAVVLPLTGFDAFGHRLGAGGGYYDRLLAGVAGRRRPWRVGFAYALQEVPQLPAEPWDVRLHAVCTERGLRRFG